MKNERRAAWTGQRIRFFMAEKNRHPTEMANQSKVKYKTFASYIEGRAEPPIVILKRICDALNITIDCFLEGLPDTVEC